MATRIAIRDEHLAAIGLAASTRRCAKLMGSGKMRLLDTRSHKSVFMPLFWGLFRGRCIRAESPLVQGVCYWGTEDVLVFIEQLQSTGHVSGFFNVVTENRCEMDFFSHFHNVFCLLPGGSDQKGN